jgi:hypothetical protein
MQLEAITFFSFELLYDLSLELLYDLSLELLYDLTMHGFAYNLSAMPIGATLT